MVEIGTATLWVASALRFDTLEEGLFVAMSSSVLVALAAIDLEHRRLPNVIVLPSTGVAVAWLVALGAVGGGSGPLVQGVASGAVAFLVFLVIALVSRGMGFGDVKLAALVGVVCGRFDPAVTAAAIFGSFIAGGVVAVALLISGRAGRKDAIPFGPSLAAGCIVALFVGEVPVRAYLGL